MFQIAQILWDGLRLRCPRCQWGAMFRGMQMYHSCPVCALEFERAAGEITGGMGINVATTCLRETLVVIWLAPRGLPLAVSMLALISFGTLFPIAFYRSSRGLWAAFLFLTGNNVESD